MSENNAPMKMKLHHLTVEITRQCNLHCAHCVRGDAQDVTITPEIIDKLLDQIDAVISLDLTGGEPFLHPEMVEYLFDGIIKRDISILTVGTVTNGTICDKRCADAFSKMAEYIKKKVELIKQAGGIDISSTVGISISSDIFHQASRLYFPEATYQFYKKHCSSDVHIGYQRKEDFSSEENYGRLAYAGRAKNLSIDKKYPFYVSSYPHRFAMGEVNGGIFCPGDENHPVSAVDKYNTLPFLVMCQIEISAKGGIYNGGMFSFDDEDAQCKDNILTCDLYNAIWNWNHRYPLLCEEERQYYKEPMALVLNHGDTHPLYQELKAYSKQLYKERFSEEYAHKCLLALDDLIWVRQQIQNRYKDRFLPFMTLWEATQDTFKEAMELPAHDLDNRWKLLRKANKELKTLLVVKKIDTSYPDLRFADDGDYEDTEDAVSDLAMMELLEKY